MKGERTVGGIHLISFQEAADRLGLDANPLAAIFYKTRNGPPYYQDRTPGSQNLRYMEMRIFVEIRDRAIPAAFKAGLRRSRLPEEHRPVGRNDGQFTKFLSKWLCHNIDLWTTEQRRIKPAEERKGKKREIFNPPLPWPEQEESLLDRLYEVESKRAEYTLTDADIDRIIEKLIARGYILMKA